MTSQFPRSLPTKILKSFLENQAKVNIGNEWMVCLFKSTSEMRWTHGCGTTCCFPLWNMLLLTLMEIVQGEIIIMAAYTLFTLQLVCFVLLISQAWLRSGQWPKFYSSRVTALLSWWGLIRVKLASIFILMRMWDMSGFWSIKGEPTSIESGDEPTRPEFVFFYLSSHLRICVIQNSHLKHQIILLL